MPARRKHIAELGIVLLLSELARCGFTKIPPVTLVTIIGQALLYMGIITVPWQKQDICISSKTVLCDKDWRRLIISPLEHGDDMHLYYNMASFLMKGCSLERRYGSKNFALLMCFLIIMTSGAYVLIGQSMTYVTHLDEFSKSCAIGFSGVLFALKVLISYEQPNLTMDVLGIPLAGKYATWAELILINVLVPNSSFIGHLAGIVTGFIYTKTLIGTIVDYIICFFTGQFMSHHARSHDHVFNWCANKLRGNPCPKET